MAMLRSVDRLQIQVLIDNTTDSLSTVPDNVMTEWPALMKAGMTELSGEHICCACHGLALVVTVQQGQTRRTLLFDGGPVDYAVGYNGRRLGIDFGAIEAVVLSHGHWDHAGGLPAALRSITAANGGRPVPCYLHPGMFRQRAWSLPGGGLLPVTPIPGPEQLAAKGAVPVVTKDAQILLDDLFYVSGEIPRVTAYEQGMPGQVRRTADGTGWEPDPLIMDERFLAVHVQGKGLVVLSACSHAGIVNVLTHARECFPHQPLHMAMGGFHLSGRNERIIGETVRDIAPFNLEMIAPGHCTGWRAINALAGAFGARVAPFAVGKIYTI